jgi:hypothetical protein
MLDICAAQVRKANLDRDMSMGLLTTADSKFCSNFGSSSVGRAVIPLTIQLMFTTAVVVAVLPSALNDAVTPAGPELHGPGTLKTT